MTEKQWTISAILAWTKQYFEGKGLDTPRLDAEVLLCHVLGKDRVYLYMNFEQPLQPEELASFRESVKQRVMRIPVAYITGIKEFMCLSFAVSPAVLIPRPDTEVLVETSLARLKPKADPIILDIGTGSGAIIISLLKRMPEAKGIAVDISEEALTVAAQNAAKHEVSDRLTLEQSNLFASLTGRTFDAIISNPPYIDAKDMETLAPEIRHEPRVALAGGNDGQDFYRRIVAAAVEYLAPAGFVALEVGEGQARQVAALADDASGLKMVDIVKDYGGIERVVVLERRQPC